MRIFTEKGLLLPYLGAVASSHRTSANRNSRKSGLVLCSSVRPMATQDFVTGGQGLPFHERSQRLGFRHIMFSETGEGKKEPGLLSPARFFCPWPLRFF